MTMATASPAPATSSNIVSGKILHKETGEGICDLLVELFDLDAWADPETPAGTAPTNPPVDAIAALQRGDVSILYKLADRIGSVVTDCSGRFLLEVKNRDFNLPGRTEQKPDLILLVMAPDEPGLTPSKRLLHFAGDIRY